MVSLDDIRGGLACGRSGCECARPRAGNVTTHCPAHDDGHTSLSVTEKAGRLLVHCHAGCSQAQVVDALKSQSLWPTSPKEPLKNEPKPLKNEPNPKRATVTNTGARTKQVVATYDYRDEAGALLFQVQRTRPKGFSQRRPDPAAPGQFIYNRDGVRNVPYRLPDLLALGDGNAPVFVCEGEKDADALIGLGLTATTNAGGAGKWPPDFGPFLAGRNVVILPDNDEAGHAHAGKVAALLHGAAKSVRVLALPGLPAKGDVSDWLDLDNTVSELMDLARRAPAWTPPGEAGPPGGVAPSFNTTDHGNAERLIHRHGADLRFMHFAGKWLTWDGSRWVMDDSGEIYRRAYDTVQGIYAEAGAEADEERRKHIGSWAVKSESFDKVTSLIRTAQHLPPVPIRLEDMDADPYLFNCGNGTLDLRTGELTPHCRRHYITKLSPVRLDAGANCPTWLGFLGRVLDASPDMIAYIQRAIGYALTGDTREECFFVLHGSGRNGKSTFIETVRVLLADYAMETPADTLMAKRGDGGVSNDVARLRGARFVSASESEDGQRLAEGLVKHMTGRDTMTARFLHQEFFEFRPQFKLFLATNHKPVIRDGTEGIWRRVHFIPFTVTIPESEVDKRLGERLRAEMPGIFAWALSGCLAWQRDGLNRPNAVLQATREYRAEMDTIGAFIEERCAEAPGQRVRASDLYRSYDQWCQEWGEHKWTQTAFGRKLSDRGYLPEKHGGIGYRLGLTLRGVV